MVVVKGSPGAIAPAVAGYFREGGGVQAAAVGHLHCVHHLLPGLEGDAEGEKVRRNALQGGEGAKGEGGGLPGVVDAVNSDCLLLKVIVAGNCAVSPAGHRAQTFAAAVDAGHGDAVRDIPALAGNAAQAAVPGYVGLGGTGAEHSPGEPRDTARKGAVVGPHGSHTGAGEGSAHLAPAQDTAGALILGGDGATVVTLVEDRFEQSGGIHQQIFTVQLQILLGVQGELRGDRSRNAAHVGVGLDAALIPAAYHPARAALGPLGRSVLLHRLFRNLGQFHNGFPGLVKLPDDSSGGGMQLLVGLAGPLGHLIHPLADVIQVPVQLVQALLSLVAQGVQIAVQDILDDIGLAVNHPELLHAALAEVLDMAVQGIEGLFQCPGGPVHVTAGVAHLISGLLPQCCQTVRQVERVGAHGLQMAADAAEVPVEIDGTHIPALIGIQDASQIQAGRSLEGVLDKGLQPVGLVRDLTQLRHKTAVFPLQCVQRGGETVSGVGQAVLQSAGQIFQPLA